MGFSRQEYWSGLPLPSPEENSNSKGYMPPSVHRTTFHSSQDMGATEMSINRSVDEDAVHIPNRMLLSHKKNEIMPFTVIGVDLEIIILGEVSQRKTKVTYHLYAEAKQ